LPRRAQFLNRRCAPDLDAVVLRHGRDEVVETVGVPHDERIGALLDDRVGEARFVRRRFATRHAKHEHDDEDAGDFSENAFAERLAKRRALGKLKSRERAPECTPPSRISHGALAFAQRDHLRSASRTVP